MLCFQTCIALRRPRRLWPWQPKTWKEASPRMYERGAYDLDSDESSNDEYNSSKEDTMDDNLLE